MFVAEYANCYPDQRAIGHYYNLYYGATLPDRFVLVAVDRGRAHPPSHVTPLFPHVLFTGTPLAMFPDSYVYYAYIG